jgi:hypothetical protein
LTESGVVISAAALPGMLAQTGNVAPPSSLIQTLAGLTAPPSTGKTLVGGASTGLLTRPRAMLGIAGAVALVCAGVAAGWRFASAPSEADNHRTPVDTQLVEEAVYDDDFDKPGTLSPFWEQCSAPRQAVVGKGETASCLVFTVGGEKVRTQNGPLASSVSLTSRPIASGVGVLEIEIRESGNDFADTKKRTRSAPVQFLRTLLDRDGTPPWATQLTTGRPREWKHGQGLKLVRKGQIDTDDVERCRIYVCNAGERVMLFADDSASWTQATKPLDSVRLQLRARLETSDPNAQGYYRIERVRIRRLRRLPPGVPWDPPE